jgi:hypothetical protein
MKPAAVAKLAKLPSKNNTLYLDSIRREVHAAGLENGHDRGNQTAPQAVGRAKGAKAEPAESPEGHRKS